MAHCVGEKVQNCSRWRMRPTLHGFHFISLQPNREGTLNQLDRNYQHAICLLPHQDSFRSIQRSATDSHPLASFEKGITFEGNLTREQSLDVLDLFFRNRYPLAGSSDEVDHAFGSQHPEPLFRTIY